LKTTTSSQSEVWWRVVVEKLETLDMMLVAMEDVSQRKLQWTASGSIVVYLDGLP
jgi:hypothetical protein